MPVIEAWYNTSRPDATATGTAGQCVSVQCDAQGRLVVVNSSASGGGTTGSFVTYNTSAPTLTNGQTAPFQGDASGNLKVVEQSAPVAEDNTNGVLAFAWKPTTVANYSPTLAGVLGAGIATFKASAGSVYSVSVTNRNAAVRYLQLHNTAAAPAGAAVPLASWYVPATSQLTLDNAFFTLSGLLLATGITFAMSTTSATYTAATAGEHDFSGTFK